MTRLLLRNPLLALLAGLAIFAAVQTWRLDRQSGLAADLARDLRAAEAHAEQQAEALAVHRAHVARMQREAAEDAETIRYLQALEGADAPLSDAARDGASRLWGE